MAAVLAVLVPVPKGRACAVRSRDKGRACAGRSTLRADMGEVRRELHVLSGRVARIEGALTALAATGELTPPGIPLCRDGLFLVSSPVARPDDKSSPQATWFAGG